MPGADPASRTRSKCGSTIAATSACVEGLGAPGHPRQRATALHLCRAMADDEVMSRAVRRPLRLVTSCALPSGIVVPAGRVCSRAGAARPRTTPTCRTRCRWPRAASCSGAPGPASRCPWSSVGSAPPTSWTGTGRDTLRAVAASRSGAGPAFHRQGQRPHLERPGHRRARSAWTGSPCSRRLTPALDSHEHIDAMIALGARPGRTSLRLGRRRPGRLRLLRAGAAGDVRRRTGPADGHHLPAPAPGLRDRVGDLRVRAPPRAAGRAQAGGPGLLRSSRGRSPTWPSTSVTTGCSRRCVRRCGSLAVGPRRSRSSRAWSVRSAAEAVELPTRLRALRPARAPRPGASEAARSASRLALSSARC